MKLRTRSSEEDDKDQDVDDEVFAGRAVAEGEIFGGFDVDFLDVFEAVEVEEGCLRCDERGVGSGRYERHRATFPLYL